MTKPARSLTRHGTPALMSCLVSREADAEEQDESEAPTKWGTNDDDE